MPKVVLLAAALSLLAADSSAARDPRPGLVAEYSDGARRVAEIVSRVAFSLEAGESIHPALSPEFTASYEGVLVVLEGGRYAFPGPARVTIGGVPAGEAPVELASGEHAIRVEVRRERGAEPIRFRALWRGEEFETEPIPPSALAHEEADEPPRIALDAAIERGRDLADAHRCGACHAGLPARKAPDLSRAGERLHPAWIAEWLGDPRAFRSDAAMPAIALDAGERRDVATYLARLAPEASRTSPAPPPDPARAESGRALFETVGCVACHAPGSLGRQGEKTSAAALARTLLDPHAADPEGGMPSFFKLAPPANAPSEARAAYDAEEADAALRIAEYLVSEGGAAAQFEPGDARRGESLLASRGCLECHPLAPEPAARLDALGLAPRDLGAGLGEWEIAGPIPGEFGGGAPASFRAAPELADGRLHALFPDENAATAWLRRTVTLERPLALALSVEADDRFDLAIDGERVLEGKRNNVGRPVAKEIALEAGPHEFLLRVFDAAGEWRFRFSATPLAPQPARAAAATAFDALDPERGCLAAEPPAAVPRYALAAADRDALRAFVASRREAPDRSPAPVHAFRASVRRLRCTGCHAFDGEEPLAALAEFPPPLGVAGEKMRASWLESVLLKTKRVRPWMGLRMPRFAPSLVAGLPRGFHAHAGVEPGEGEAFPEPPRDVRLSGVKLLGRSEFSCISCHDYREWTALGTRGPDLREMHARIRPEWFRRWMRRPSRVLPGTSMPLFFGSTPPGETERRIDELAAALALGDHLPPPDGLVSASAERDTRRPIVVRAFLPGASPAAIAVGLEGFVSYGFDTLDCRVFVAWEGDFLDMAPAWAQKGETLPRLLGKVFLEAKPGALALRRGDASRDPVYRYRGHALAAGESPELRFDVDGAPVALRAEALDGGLGLRLRYRAEGDGPFFLMGADIPGARVACEPGTREGSHFRVASREFAVTIVPEETETPR